MSPAEIDSLPLHDALLESSNLSWQTALCTLQINVFLQRGGNAKPCKLRFSGLTQLHVPKQQPWGPSVSINGAKFENGSVQIEMQSGDTISIVATEMEFGAL
jgi:hypothetical protein